MSEHSKEYGWDDKIDTKPPEKILLPKGPAIFTVLEFKRARGECGKYGTANYAKLTLLVRSSVDKNEAEIEENLWLILDLKWKVLQFFASIGQRKHGDEGDFTPNWAEVDGASGPCIVGHRSFESKKGANAGKTITVHQIEEFLQPEAEPFNGQF